MEIRKIENAQGNVGFFAFGEDKEFICKCGKELKEGYICENNSIKIDEETNKEIEYQKVFCKECQDSFNMGRYCKHDKKGEHRHIKFERGKHGNTEDNNSPPA